MESINLNEYFSEYISNISNNGVKKNQLENNNVNSIFASYISDANNNNLDLNGSESKLIQNLSQKYNINISIKPTSSSLEMNPNLSSLGSTSDGRLTSAIIPPNLLKKMTYDTKVLQEVESAIKTNLDSYEKIKPTLDIMGDKMITGPIVFNDDGSWSIFCMSANDQNTDSDKKDMKETLEDDLLQLLTLKSNNHSQSIKKLNNLDESSFLNYMLNDKLADNINANFYAQLIDLYRNKKSNIL